MVKEVTTRIDDDTLVISVPREFVIDLIHHAWAPEIIARHPGPFRTITIDLSRCGLLTSGFISQIFQLQERYRADGAECILDRPDPRFQKVLEVVGIAGLFKTIPR